jgi:hypothetical protein
MAGTRGLAGNVAALARLPAVTIFRFRRHQFHSSSPEFA